MDKTVTAFIAVTSRELRYALQALLESMTEIHAVYQTSDVQASTDMLKTHPPAIMLCDYVIFNQIGVLGTTQVLVLVDNRVQQDQVVAKGVSHVVITGTPVGHLVTMIHSLLNPREGTENDG